MTGNDGLGLTVGGHCESVVECDAENREFGLGGEGLALKCELNGAFVLGAGVSSKGGDLGFCWVELDSPC